MCPSITWFVFTQRIKFIDTIRMHTAIWIFILRASFYSHRSNWYKAIGVELDTRFADAIPNQRDAPQIIAVKPVKLPDITYLKEIQRNGYFSLFTQKRIQCVVNLIKILDECKTMDDLLSIALYVRDEVNSIHYSYSVALMHRTNSKVELHSLEIITTNFFEKDTIKLATRMDPFWPTTFA